MTTYTSRVQAPKPDAVGEVVDVSLIQQAFDKFDTAAGLTVCTSATRPSTPYDGQVIKETDTKAFGFWDAATTRWLMWDTTPQYYTPKMYGGATAITQGGGFLTGWYMRRGMHIEFAVHTSVGAGTTYPAGTMYYGLPFEMEASPAGIASLNFIEGKAQILDSSASQIFNAYIRTGDSKKCVIASASPGFATTNYEVVLTNVNLASGAGFGAGDVTTIQGRYIAKDYVAL